MRPGAGFRFALRLAWQAGPLLIAARLGLTAAMGVLPVVVAYGTKLLLDEITAGGGEIAGPVSVLAAVGLLLALLPLVSRYVIAEQDRAILLRARDLLYGMVGKSQGLARFENPAFHDRLRLAAEEGPQGPGQVLEGTLAIVQGVVMLGGFLTALGGCWITTYTPLTLLTESSPPPGISSRCPRPSRGRCPKPSPTHWGGSPPSTGCCSG